MDITFTDEDLKGFVLKADTEAANMEVRNVILAWINQDNPQNIDSFVDFYRKAFKVCINTMLKEIDKSLFPEGIDDNTLSVAEQHLDSLVQAWLQDANVSLPLYLEFILSSFAGLVKLAETGQMGQETSGGQVLELFLQKYMVIRTMKMSGRRHYIVC